MAVSPVVRDNESADFFDGISEGRFLLRLNRYGRMVRPPDRR